MSIIRLLFDRLVIGAQFLIGSVLLIVFLAIWAVRRGRDDDDLDD